MTYNFELVIPEAWVLPLIIAGSALGYLILGVLCAAVSLRIDPDLALEGGLRFLAVTVWPVFTIFWLFCVCVVVTDEFILWLGGKRKE